MTLPASGPITAAQIRTELGLAPGATFTIPSAEIRALTGVASGPIVWPNDFWGKSAVIADYQGNFSATGTGSSATVTIPGVTFGAASGTRRMFMSISVAGASAADRSLGSATIGGIAATIHTQTHDRNTGTSAIFILAIISAEVPTGTSGDVVVTVSGVPSSGNYTVKVLSYRAMSLTGAIVDADSGHPVSGGSHSISVTSPSSGFLIVTALQREGGSIDITDPATAEDYTDSNFAGLFQTGHASGSQTCTVSAPSAGTCAIAAITWQHT